MSFVRGWQRPHAGLRALIDRYWWCEGPAGTPLPVLLPGAGAEIHFHLGHPLSMSGRPGLDGPVPAACLVAVREGPVFLRAERDFHFLAVRIRAEAVRHVCPGVPTRGMAEVIDLGESWGRRAASCLAQLQDCAGLAGQLALLDRWLLARVSVSGTAPAADLADRVARLLYYRHDRVRIEPLARRCGISPRQLERRFGDAFACSPKNFHRRARFHHVVRDLLLHPGRDMLDAALEHGYFDQSHFIREFTRFAGQTPAGFLAQCAGVSHFYNAPSGLSVDTGGPSCFQKDMS